MYIPNVNNNKDFVKIEKTKPPYTSEDNPDDYTNRERGPEEFECEYDELQ